MAKKQKNKKDFENLAPQEQEFIDNSILADSVYEIVLSQLKIDHGDAMYRALILGVLKRQSKDFMVFKIWNGLSPTQLEHLKDFMPQTFVVAPWMEHGDVLLEFAMMYDDLMDKVYAGLSEFFRDFIEKFNRIAEA